MDVSLMVGVTDIPDWCFVETMGTQASRRPLARSLPRMSCARALVEGLGGWLVGAGRWRRGGLGQMHA